MTRIQTSPIPNIIPVPMSVIMLIILSVLRSVQPIKRTRALIVSTGEFWR